MSANGGIKRHIPNVLTLVNLCCGFLAVHFIFQSQWKIVVTLLIIAGVADLLDGLLARALNVQGDLGEQLDSLADMVSFGVVPGLIVFRLFPQTDDIYSSPALLALLIPMSSALRLAKFNIQSNNTGDFQGLATPSSAAVIVGYLAFYKEDLHLETHLILLSLMVSILMISNITFFSLKFKGMGWKNNALRWIFIPLGVILLFWLKAKSLFILMLAYILTNVVVHFYKKFTG